MSDSGDPQFAKRVGKIALGGAATMSSLYIQNKRSAVDDAGELLPTILFLTLVGYGMASHKQSQFSSPAASIRTSFSSRSLSNQFPMKKLDPDDSKLGLKVKDDNDYFDGLVNNPNSTRNEGHPLGPPFNFSDKTQLTRMRNNSDSNTTPTGLWTVAEDYPLMKRDYKKKAFGLFKDELIPSPHLEQQQHRIRKQDGRHNDIERDLHSSPSPISSPNLHLDSISTSKYLESDNPIINPPTLPPKVRTTPTKPYSSPSLYLSPLCTMTEYQGGIPSLLTKEILTFVSKIDNFDATWRRYLYLFIGTFVHKW